MTTACPICDAKLPYLRKQHIVSCEAILFGLANAELQRNEISTGAFGAYARRSPNDPFHQQ